MKGYVYKVKVSAIIPCYNPDEVLLVKCIESILAQTYGDFEIIIVNDGSDEKFAFIFAKISRLDERIRILDLEHAGVSAARNCGIVEAEGEYIVFVDADDVIVPCFFSESIEIAERENADCVIGAVCSTKNVSEKIEHIIPIRYSVYDESKKDELKPYIALSKNLQVGEKGYISRGPVSRLIRTNIAKQAKFDKCLSVGEDRIWNLELLRNCNKVCVVSQIWYLYYRNDASVCHKYNPKIALKVKDYLMALIPYLDFANDTEYFYYVLTILDDLWLIYHCYLKYKDGFLNKRERKKEQLEVYISEPWTMIDESRFFKLAPLKVKIKALLFRYHLLFTYYDTKRNI